MFYQEMILVYIVPVALVVLSLVFISAGMGILGEFKSRAKRQQGYAKTAMEEKASYYNKKKVQEGIAS